MGKRGFAQLILVLAVASIAVLAIVIRTSTQKAEKSVPNWETGPEETPTPTANTDTPTPTIPDPYGFEIPQLPAGFDWTVVSREDFVLNRLNWKEVGSDDFNKNEVALEGTEWRAIKALNSESERIEFYMGVDPFEHFRDFFLKRRWEYRTLPSFTIGEYAFSVLNSAGSLSELEGYFKQKEGLIRVTYFSHNLDERFVQEGGQFIYPHIVEFRLFVSDLMPEDQLVQQITAPLKR